MNLLEAIVEANHRAMAGDHTAGLHPDEFAASLPVVALTCIDPRLNPLMPAVLGISAEQFIWLRNAGNIITSPLSSTMRSLALACAIKGGKEIAVIGHTDCRIRFTNVLELTDRFRALGIDRALLPDNLNEFFGLFGSEHQNVVKAVDFIRQSPLIGAKIPIHGLMVNIQNGQLDWVVNGYQNLGRAMPMPGAQPKSAGLAGSAMAAFNFGEMKFPNFKIGEGVRASEELDHGHAPAEMDVAPAKAKSETIKPQNVPLPPLIQPIPRLKQGRHH